MTIESLTGAYTRLDNTHRLKRGIPIKGLGQARSVEQAYYMLRAMDDIAALAVMRTTTGIGGKRVAEEYKRQGGELIDDWVSKVAIMLRAVDAAVALNPDVAELLEATGDEEIVEGNDWGDPIWGRPFVPGPDGTAVLGEGYNLTGRAWMTIREMRRSPEYAPPEFSEVVLDRADQSRFVDEARGLLMEAGFPH